jgi:hypothetical protein
MDESVQSLFTLTSEWQAVKRKIAALLEDEQRAVDPEEKARLVKERRDYENREAALNQAMKEAQALRRSGT